MRGLVTPLVLLAAVAGAQPMHPMEEFPGARLRPPRMLPKPPPKPAPAPEPKPPPRPQPPPKPIPPPRPAPPQKPAPTLRPAPPKLTSCVVGLEVVQTRTGEGATLEGFVTNRTSRAVTMTLQNPCPTPPMAFEGLPPGVFAFQTCAMGPCVSREPIVVTLAPKERRLLATGFVPWSGGPCSAPVEPQVFSVRGVVRFEGAALVTCEVPKAVTAPKCPRPEPCGVYCEFGQAKDENGCTTCGCNPNPLRMPGGQPF
ncbi:MAG: hypothetical protein JNM69_27715 [Archangium sp.]|nr:hypothetical protein [Archangium sp.]